MPIVFWDASGLAKRYAAEAGSVTVDAVFSAASQFGLPMVGTVLGYAETFATLLRKRNRGSISRATFAGAKSLLRDEIVSDPDFLLLTIDDKAIFSALALMEQYNCNASDAAILRVFLDYQQAQFPTVSPGILIASDERLLRAASAEGLATLNPELLLPADVPGTLASL